MDGTPRNLPFSMAALVMGALSIPLAFARHLVSLALVLAVLALVLSAWGRWRVRRAPRRFGPASVRRARWAGRLALAGLAASATIWALWAGQVLLF
jgi:hypothetical protein